MRLPIFFALFAIPIPFLHSESEIIWREDFDSGAGAAAPYRSTEVIEYIKENETAFLRVTLPGEKTLEGTRISMGPIEGDRLLFITAKVRGSGTIGPMVQASNGWTRLAAVNLSKDWQEIRIPKTLKAGTNNPVIYFVSLPMDTLQPGAIFEISELKATLAPPLSLTDSEVKPHRFEIEDYTSNARSIREEDGLTCVIIRNPFASEEIPFPQTRQPVSIYLRYRPSSLEDRVQLSTRRGGVKQSIRELNPPIEGWQWLEFPSLSAEEVGEGFSLEVWTDPKADQPAAVDALLLSTTASLDESFLNSTR